MSESLVRVKDELLDRLRAKYPELDGVSDAGLVNVALRKLLQEDLKE